MKEEFFSYISSNLDENRLAHAFLIETNDKEALNNQLISFLFDKKLIKNENYENNLNLIVVEPDGKEIKTGEIESLKTRFSTLPANDKYNIYIIKGAELLNISAANKLLKFLEEPTDYILGFLLVAEGSNVLPTITSRCQEFRLLYEKAESSSDDCLKAWLSIIEKKEYEVCLDERKVLAAAERTELINSAHQAISYLENSLSSDSERVTAVSANIFLFDKILRLLKSNVNIELVLDVLSIEVR